MPISDCGVCAQLFCGAGSIDQDQWRVLVAKLLCESTDSLSSLVAISGGGLIPVQSTELPITEVLFSDLTNAFVVALNDTHDKKYINIYNGTDAGVYVSFDGGITINDLLPPYTALVKHYGDWGEFQAGTVALKYQTAPSSGEVIISASY